MDWPTDPLPTFYPILDAAVLERRGMALLPTAEAMLEEGVRMLQWRRKAPLTRDSLDELERLAQACQRRGVLLVINDRADLARLLGGGLHLGQDDIPVSAARAVAGWEAVVGLSTHNGEQVAAAAQQAVQYVAVGPIFATKSKERPDPEVGLEGLRECRRLTALPLVAIGGITRRTVRAVLAAGADTVAGIGDAIPEQGTMEALRHRTREWLEVSKGTG